MRFFVLIAIALAAGASIDCSEPDRIDVMLECPSPDRSLLAVLFWQAGGGAAGWAEFVLTLQPANVPVTRPPTGRGGEAEAVLRASHAQKFELNRDANDHLSVSVAYPDLGTVLYLFHQYPMNGKRQVRVTFTELESDPRDVMPTHVTCQSGSLRIENPPSKRVK